MNDSQIDALQIILNNETIMRSLRKVFEDTLATSLPTVFNHEDNEVVGQKYRAYHDATNIVHNAFRSLESYKKVANTNSSEPTHI